MVSGNNGRIGRSGGKLCFLDMSDQKCQFLSFYALNIIHGLVSFQVWDTGVPIGGFPMGGVPMGGFPMGGVPMGGVPMGGFPMGGVPMGGFPMGGVPMGGFPMGGVPMGGVPIGGED